MPGDDDLVLDAINAVEIAYIGFESGDIEATKTTLHDNIEFEVHPRSTTSFLGQGVGKELFAQRLGNFLADYYVLNFEVASRHVNGQKITCRVVFHYKHKKTGMEIDGSMRHEWLVENGKVVRLDLMTDANKMSAYFELSAQG